MKRSKIAVVGLGKLGSALTQELIRSKLFSDIYLANRSTETLQGSFLSFNVFNSIVGSNTTIHILDSTIPEDIDLVVIAVKEKYDPRYLLETEILPQGLDHNVRNIGLAKDLPLLFDVSKILNGYTGKIIVLSNPVDVMTVMFKNWCPLAQVFGLGVTLDTARLAYSAGIFGFEAKYDDLQLGGTHTQQLVSLKSLWNKSSQLLNCSNTELNKILNHAAGLGPKIVEGLGYTLHDCVEIFLRDIEWFLGEDSTRNLLCASVGDKHSATAQPLMHSSEGMGIVRYSALTENEQILLKSTAKEISKIIEVLKMTLLPPIID